MEEAISRTGLLELIDTHYPNAGKGGHATQLRRCKHLLHGRNSRQYD